VHKTGPHLQWITKTVLGCQKTNGINPRSAIRQQQQQHIARELELYQLTVLEALLNKQLDPYHYLKECTYVLRQWSSILTLLVTTRQPWFDIIPCISKKNTSHYMNCTTFFTYFLTRAHTTESSCININPTSLDRCTEHFLIKWKDIQQMLISSFLLCLLTLSVRAEYIYSAASQTTSPDGVYILRDFHKVVKWPGTVDFKV
jgi:hypothetical protein